jgi:hypothetical protein
MTNLPNSGQANSLDNFNVDRADYRQSMENLLAFLAQGLGGVTGAYGTQAVDPTALKLSLAAGTAAAPGLAFSGDADTGLFSPGANQLGVATGGADRVHLTASGDILLGGALPSNPNIKLQVDGAGIFANTKTQLLKTGGIYTITDTTTAETELLFGQSVSNGAYGLLAYYPTGYAAVTGHRQQGSVVLQSSGVGDKALRLLAQRSGDVVIHTGPGVVNPATAVVRGTTGDFLIGGTLPAAPNITLKADGSINAKGAVARVYADNTAAKAGGLVDGDIYRKADGTLMIVFT